MKQLPINDPEYWRERAEEARRIAEQLADAFSKQTMLESPSGHFMLRPRALQFDVASAGSSRE